MKKQNGFKEYKKGVYVALDCVAYLQQFCREQYSCDLCPYYAGRFTCLLKNPCAVHLPSCKASADRFFN